MTSATEIRYQVVVRRDPEYELQLDWHYHTGDPNVDRGTERLRRQRAELESAKRDLAQHTNDLARQLVTTGGFSVRESRVLAMLVAVQT